MEKEEDVENPHNDFPTILKLIYTFTELNFVEKKKKSKMTNWQICLLSVFIISL